MSLYHVIETTVVAAIVASAALSVFARYAPRTRERVKAGLAHWLTAPGRPAILAKLAPSLAPRVDAGCHSGSDGGCSTGGGCDSCGSGNAASDVQLIQIVRKPR